MTFCPLLAARVRQHLTLDRAAMAHSARSRLPTSEARQGRDHGSETRGAAADSRQPEELLWFSIHAPADPNELQSFAQTCCRRARRLIPLPEPSLESTWFLHS